MISCSKCKKATLPISDGGCIRTGGIVDIGCEHGEPRVLTHYDRLISKTPEEMAEWLVFIEQRILEIQPALERPPLYKDWLDWLKQEEEE